MEWILFRRFKNDGVLHDTKNDDGIKNFFTEVYELYLRILLNPFYKYNSSLSHSKTFDERVKYIGRRYL